MIGPRGLPAPKILLLALLCLLLWISTHNFAPALKQHAFKAPPGAILEDPARESRHPVASNTTVNLVVASTAKDDITWTSKLQIPNLNVVRYVSDSETALYHPPAPKGREALMYFTYLHDFYDELPDISIFVHPQEYAWHVDGALRGSMSFALEHVDLQRVIKEGYFNLRASWKDACPVWINTSKTFEDWDKREEPYMIYAWQANFGEEEPMPEMLGGPCCSQFAVSREAIRSRPKEQYKRSMEWLVGNEFGDYIAGRVWEHLWPQLFRREGTDCKEEVLVLCRMYGVCFGSVRDLEEYNLMWDERVALREKQSFWNTVAYPGTAKQLVLEIEGIEEALQERLSDALARGKQSSELSNIHYWPYSDT